MRQIGQTHQPRLLFNDYFCSKLSWTWSYKQNFSIEFDSTLELTNQIDHFSFSDGPIFQHNQIVRRNFYRISSRFKPSAKGAQWKIGNKGIWVSKVTFVTQAAANFDERDQSWHQRKKMMVSFPANGTDPRKRRDWVSLRQSFFLIPTRPRSHRIGAGRKTEKSHNNWNRKLFGSGLQSWISYQALDLGLVALTLNKSSLQSDFHVTRDYKIRTPRG